jgi:oligoendopeptidase F
MLTRRELRHESATKHGLSLLDRGGHDSQSDRKPWIARRACAARLLKSRSLGHQSRIHLGHSAGKSQAMLGSIRDWQNRYLRTAGASAGLSGPVADTADAVGGGDAFELGPMPEWDLSDLYPAPDSPKIADDLKRVDEKAKRFEANYKGKLHDIIGTSDGARRFAAVIRDYEELDDLFGRLWSYAGLLHATDVSDTDKAKFYGDVSEKLTATGVHLLFFSLEINRIEDALLDRAMNADPELAHYRPWLEDVRKEKPYQLEDDLERLFHEKSVTGRGAWNRLFDETISGLRFELDGEELTIEPTLNKLQDSDGAVRKAAAEALGKTFSQEHAHLCADHQHAVERQGNLGPLARVRRHC